MRHIFAILALVLLGPILSCQEEASVSFSAYTRYFSSNDSSISKSGIQAAWTLPSINQDMQHFTVKWHKASEAVSGPNMESSPLIIHHAASLSYVYDIQDLVQGECYYVFLYTAYNDSSLSISGPVIVQTRPAILHNLTFQAIGLNATVTWDLRGDYIASGYIVYILSDSEVVQSNCYLDADKNSPKVCTETLTQGVHYHAVTVSLTVSTTCTFRPEREQAILKISYMTAPAAPVRVELTNLPTSPFDTLVAKWEMPMFFPWINYVVVVTDVIGNTIRLGNIVANETAITGLSSSEKYSVTVQAGNIYTDPFLYSEVSEPSNDAITAPGTFTISAVEVLGVQGTPMQTVYVSWEKPKGGEEIDTYEVKWKALSSGGAQIPHIKGHTFYDIYVSNLKSGRAYDFEVIATNIAGNSKSNIVTVHMK